MVLHGWFIPVPYAGGLPSCYVMLLIGLMSDVQVVFLPVCSFFILKLILSCLPVHLTYSLPSSPRLLFADVEELSESGERCLGIPMGGCQRYVTGSKHLFQRYGGKCCIMSVGVIGDWANVRCTGRYGNISFRIKTTHTHTHTHAHTHTHTHTHKHIYFRNTYYLLVHLALAFAREH